MLSNLISYNDIDTDIRIHVPDKLLSTSTGFVCNDN